MPARSLSLVALVALGAGASAQQFKLSAPLGAGAVVHSFVLAPDGSRAVYAVDQGGFFGPEALFSRRISPDATAVQISDPLVANGAIGLIPSTGGPLLINSSS